MLDTTKFTPAQIRRAAMEAVIREVGVVGLVRLLRDEIPGSGNYAEDREAFLPKFESMDDLMKTIGVEGAANQERLPSPT